MFAHWFSAAPSGACIFFGRLTHGSEPDWPSPVGYCLPRLRRYARLVAVAKAGRRQRPARRKRLGNGGATKPSIRNPNASPEPTRSRTIEGSPVTIEGSPLTFEVWSLTFEV